MDIQKIFQFLNSPRLRTSLIALVTLVIGLTAGWQLAVKRANKELIQNFRQIRANNSELHYSNPLIGCGFSENNYFTELKPLRDKLLSVISQAKAVHGLKQASVYFRELDTGHWVGIDENEKYTPASLLKLPIMVAYLKKAQGDPEILKKVIYYAGDDSGEKDKASNLEKDHSYTVGELIANMIVSSDNVAKNLLLKNVVDLDYLHDVFRELGIRFPNEQDGNYEISVKTFSLFFRTLYNATFLSREASENAFMVLSKAEFKDGIVAGVPGIVTVAHKYGEFLSREPDGAPHVELHDCGIVYKTENPYLLCVMTEGKDLSAAKQLIADISRVVYENAIGVESAP